MKRHYKLEQSLKTHLPWGRDEIEYPCSDKADPYELKEGLCRIDDPLANRPVSKDTKYDGDEKSKGDQVKKMDHFFLP
jgi:hypothetical protein